MVSVSRDEILRRELQTYETHRRGLVDRGDGGRYVLISGEKVDGVYDSREEGLRVGYQTHGASPFLVREIRAEDRTWHVGRVRLWT